MFRSSIVILAAVGLLAACQQKTEQAGEMTEPSVDVQAEKQALDQLRDSYQQAVAAKDAEALVGFWTDDVVWINPDGSTLRGHDAIREANRPMIEAPGTASMTINPENTVVSSSGDIAYEYGSYTTTMSTPDGKASSETHNYLVTFRKVDGQWKLTSAADSGPVKEGGESAPATTS